MAELCVVAVKFHGISSKADDNGTHRTVNDAKENGRKHNSNQKPNPEKKDEMLFQDQQSDHWIRRRENISQHEKHSRERCKNWMAKISQSVTI